MAFLDHPQQPVGTSLVLCSFCPYSERSIVFVYWNRGGAYHYPPLEKEYSFLHKSTGVWNEGSWERAWKVAHLKESLTGE